MFGLFSDLTINLLSRTSSISEDFKFFFKKKKRNQNLKYIQNLNKTLIYNPMSFFINNGNNVFSTETVDPVKLERASIQFDVLNVQFNGILDQCYTKCIDRQQYNEGDLTKGENMCIGRCVTKFLTVNKYIGEYMRDKHYYEFTPKNILKHYDSCM